ncbi:MAG TPA: hypothetical protein VGK32_22265 [Vicinamibacterales bacterium]|jgi:hypothetical protein
MAKDLGQDELRRFARLGAQARLEQLEEERRAILRAFPGLAATVARQKKSAPAEASEPAASVKKPRRKRRKMSAAEKKAASERMKKYWVERRKAKA